MAILLMFILIGSTSYADIHTMLQARNAKVNAGGGGGTDYVPDTIEFKWSTTYNGGDRFFSFAIYNSSFDLLTNGKSSNEAGPGSSSEDSASFTNCTALTPSSSYHIAAGTGGFPSGIITNDTVQSDVDDDGGDIDTPPNPFEGAYHSVDPFVFVIKNASGQVLIDSEGDFTDTDAGVYAGNHWKVRDTVEGGYICNTL